MVSVVVSILLTCLLRVATLNTHSSSLHLHSSFHSALTESDVCDVTFSEADVLEAISRLKLGKSDAEGFIQSM